MSLDRMTKNHRTQIHHHPLLNIADRERNDILIINKQNNKQNPFDFQCQIFLEVNHRRILNLNIVITESKEINHHQMNEDIPIKRKRD